LNEAVTVVNTLFVFHCLTIGRKASGCYGVLTP